MFAPMGSGGNSKWSRNSLSQGTKSGGVNLGGRSESGRKKVCVVFPAKITLEVTEEETFPDLESGEQHLVPALPLIVCAI